MLQEIVNRIYFQNRILDYLIFFLIIVLGIGVIKISQNIALKSLKGWSKKTATELDDFLIHIFEKTLIPLLYYGIFFLSTRNLTLHSSLSKAIDIGGVALLTILGIHFISGIVEYAIKNYWLKDAEETRIRSLKGILPAIKVIVWGLGIIFLLDNLGFKISTVIAGLGIGGIAVAMASQAVLGDLFSYFSIIFDRPFETGDFIIVGDYLGAVEHIGIKTTRIRSLSGEQLVFSNTDLTNSRLRNYKRMENRRVVFSLGVTYQTGLQLLKEIPKIIEDAIKKIDKTAFDRAHFKAYGDFSLIYEVVYIVLSGDYKEYMDIQQEINFTVKEEFEKRGIEFAYPTQELYLHNRYEGKE